MRTRKKILWPWIILTLGIVLSIVIVLIIVLHKKTTPPKNGKTPPKNGKTPSPTGTFFLTAENQGFLDKTLTLPDLSMFETGVIIYLDVSHVAASKFFEQSENLLKAAGLTNFKYWIQFDVEGDGKIGKCSNVDTCQKNMWTQITSLQKDTGKTISGIYIDKGGIANPTNVVKAIENLADKYDLEMAWTGAYTNCASNCPATKCGKQWDHCFGQMYTTGTPTQKIYASEGCGRLDVPEMKKLWIGRNKNNFGVPLFCGGGDCQGDGTDCKECKRPIGTCSIDERLNTQGLKDIVTDRSPTLPNIGIWFGNNKKFTSCKRCE